MSAEDGAAPVRPRGEEGAAPVLPRAFVLADFLEVVAGTVAGRLGAGRGGTASAAPLAVRVGGGGARGASRRARAPGEPAEGGCLPR